jgi:hypothetical protein
MKEPLPRKAADHRGSDRQGKRELMAGPVKIPRPLVGPWAERWRGKGMILFSEYAGQAVAMVFDPD